MKRFFKNLLVFFVGSIVTVFLIFVIVVSIITAITANEKKPFKSKPESVYHLKLDRPITERSPESILDILGFAAQSGATMGMNDIIRNIKRAAEDDNIEGVFLEVSYFQAGMATANEIRAELDKLKAKGKFIVAYGDYFDKKAYYLATIADEVYMNPVGYLEFVGLKSEINFFKGTFEKIGIEPKVLRIGKYKGYGERYDKKKLSDENWEQIESFVSGSWKLMVMEIGSARKIKTQELERIASELDMDTPKKCVDNHLVDGLKYKDEVLTIIKQKCGLLEGAKVNLISHAQMNKMKDEKNNSQNKVAVVYAWGDVIMGNGTEGSIGAQRISRAIKKAREDKSVKAIVLRVNSGGGSALASKIIWRELELAQMEKPVIASMGDVAASGGYYIAVPADTIISSIYTLTGSIGVFGILFNAEDLLNDKLGITHETIRTNPYADIGSIYRPMSIAEEKSIGNTLKVIYDDFVNDVAQGRNKSYDYIHEIAQGRVWLGKDALLNELVDFFGGLNDAVELAAKTANIQEYSVVELPELKGIMEGLLDDATEKIKQNSLKYELGNAYEIYKELNDLMELDRFQARNAFDLKIE